VEIVRTKTFKFLWKNKKDKIKRSGLYQDLDNGGIRMIDFDIRGVTTLTNAVSGQSQNCSGNQEISPGIGRLGNFSGKHAIIPGHCRKKSGHRRNFYLKFLFRLTSAS